MGRFLKKYIFFLKYPIFSFRTVLDLKKRLKIRFKLSLYLPTVFRYPLAIIQWSFNIPKTKWKFNSRPFKRKQITFSFHMENRRIMFFHYQKFPISLSNNRKKKESYFQIIVALDLTFTKRYDTWCNVRGENPFVIV